MARSRVSIAGIKEGDGRSHRPHLLGDPSAQRTLKLVVAVAVAPSLLASARS